MGGLVVLSGLVPLGFGCSDPGVTAVSHRTSALAGGSIDPDTPAVYALELSAPAPLLCSAVLVAPNLMLTARHCVSAIGEQTVECGRAPLGELVEPEFVTLSNVLSFVDAPATSSGATVLGFEVPEEGNDVCGFDLAAVLLDDNVAGTLPLGLRFDDPPTPGERFTAVGYGRATPSAGSRAGIRLKLDDREVTCVSDACTTPAATSEFGGSDGVCLGDSGGPAIDREGRVFGIASRSVTGCEAPIYSSIAAFEAWLRPLLSEAAERGGFDLEPSAPDDEPDDGPDDPPDDRPGDPRGVPPVEPSESAPRAVTGERCTATRSCEADLVCFYENTPDEARCTPSCSTTDECAKAEVCDEEFSVCRVPGNPAPADGGCALVRRGVEPRRGRAAPFTLLVLGVGLRRRVTRRVRVSRGRA